MLHTARLTIDELQPDLDAPFVLELLSEPAFKLYIGDRGVNDLVTANGYITSQNESYQREGRALLAVRTSDGEGIGICGLLRRDPIPDVEIGFAFLSRHWGKGYASEAAAAVMEMGRSRLGLRRIAALTSQDNEASIAVLRKLGFQFVQLIVVPGYDTERRLFHWVPPETSDAS